jgi:hypothetical protein
VQAKVNGVSPRRLSCLCCAQLPNVVHRRVQRRLPPSLPMAWKLADCVGWGLWVDSEARGNGSMKTGEPVGMHYERC